jgi:RNA polymerase sigma factor (sigma-70 family)
VPGNRPDITALIPMVRRIVRARVSDPVAADDLIQETLLRVLGAAGRVEPGMLEPYAITTARHVVASMWRERDRDRRNEHRLVDLRLPQLPDAGLLAREEREALALALERLPERERQTLLAHEVHGADTRALARDLGCTAGAVAAQLNRTRARLRVEYLLVQEGSEPPSGRCRPVLLAISGGDRRRQREVDSPRHLLECDLCARLSRPLTERRPQRADEERVRVCTDPDVVLARRAAREAALRVGFTGTDLTVIAAAVSEVARAIVRSADVGEIVVEELSDPRAGVRVVARDTGRGIADLAGPPGGGHRPAHGLGLPGARRLMDEFVVVSERHHGTTVTMTKWLSKGASTSPR